MIKLTDYINLFCRLLFGILVLACVVFAVMTSNQSKKINWRSVAEEVPYEWQDRDFWGKDGIRFHKPKSKYFMLADIERLCGKPVEKFTLVKRENEEDRPEVLTFHVYPTFMLMESDFSPQPHSVAFIIVIE